MASIGEMVGKFREFASREILADVCEVHEVPMWAIQIPTVEGYKCSIMCPACTKEKRDKEEQELILQADINHQLLRTHRQFSRESIISSELKGATFDTFKVENGIDQKALNFAKRMCRHYFENGMGNAVFTGPPGVGKSHLTVAMARALNHNFRVQNRPKSIIFLPVSRLFSKVQESFSGGNDFTQERAIRLLSQVDLLFRE